ncbi:MAG: mechanosensitive ion channel family protein [Sphingomonadaceae bacterium]
MKAGNPQTESETDQSADSSGQSGDNSSQADSQGDNTGSDSNGIADTVAQAAEPVFSPESEHWVGANIDTILFALATALALYLVLKWMRRGLVKVNQNLLDKGEVERRGITSLPRRVIVQTTGFFLVTLSLRLAAYFTDAPAGIIFVTTLAFKLALIIQSALWIKEVVLAILDQRIAMLEHEKAAQLKNARELISVLVKSVIYIFAGLSILKTLGVDVTGLIAGLGIGGIAVGLAAQNIFSDLFAALSIVVDRPFVRGEKVEFDGMRGYVKKTGLQTTTLTTNNGDELIISNANIIDKTLINWSRAKKKRSRLVIDIDSTTPVSVARKIPDLLEKIVKKRGLDYVRSGFSEFKSGGFRFKLVYDVQTDDYNQVIADRHEVGMDIIEALQKEGITFAFDAPQLLAIDDDQTVASISDDAEDVVMKDSKTD